MADNVTLIVNETIDNVIINPSISTEVIDVNVSGTDTYVDISVTPNLTTVNINQVTGSGLQDLQSVTNLGATTTTSITANSFVKSGGTAAQILAANGSVITAGTNITITGGTISSTNSGATNLTTSQTASNFTINSDTGTDAAVPLGNGTLAGATLNDYTTAEKSKLAGIEAGANLGVPYTGATSDVNLGEFGIQLGNLEFDNSPTNIPTTAGSMYYNDTDGTLDLKLKGGNVTLQIGQEQLVRVVNKTATNISLLEANYQAVRITGAQGQRMKVDLAQATNDVLSSETIGLVTETIANNQEGFVTTSGIVRGINTTGSLQSETWLDGDILYLSPTVAGRITKVKPTAPNHLIIIGYVIYAHITQGTIFVKVNNGYGLDELQNVKITSAANNNVLAYTSATDIWENKTVETALGYTPYNATNPSGYQTAAQVQTIADAKVVQTITNGVTTTAPSQDAVFDALALKANDNAVVHLAGSETMTGIKTIAPVTQDEEDFPSRTILTVTNADTKTGEDTILGKGIVAFSRGTAIDASSDFGLAIRAFSEGTAIEAISYEQTAIEASSDGIAIKAISDIGTSIFSDIGPSAKGLVINSLTASTGNVIEFNKNSVNKLLVNQDGNITTTGTISASNLSGTNTGDNATNTTSNSYADAKVVQTITNGVTATAPSQDAVFDALALKQNTITLSTIGAVPNTNAATLTGSVLNLQPASFDFGGVVTTGTQTFKGNKSFADNIVLEGLILLSDESGGANVLFATDGSFYDINNKQNTISLTTTGTTGASTLIGNTLNIPQYSGGVTSVTGTAPVVSSGGTTPAISMAAATASVNGYLTSTNFTTFNNKQNTITLTTTGTTGASTLIGSTLNIPQYSGATNLGYTASPTNGLVTSSTGTSATLTLADATNAGLFTPAEKTKLAGIATGATVGVIPNAAITGATNTKITYDSKGLVTAGSSLIATDIPTITQAQVTNLTTDLAAKAPLASPTFTGTPSLPTGTTGTTQTPLNNSTRLATTAYVEAACAVVAGATGVQVSSQDTFSTNKIATVTAAQYAAFVTAGTVSSTTLYFITA